MVKTKRINQKIISENILHILKYVFMAETLIDLNTETLAESDQNQQRQINGENNNVTDHNFSTKDTITSASLIMDIHVKVKYFEGIKFQYHFNMK